MTCQINRLAARAFTEQNLALLAADVLALRKRAALPLGSKVHELASLCLATATEGDEYQEAERLIVQFALANAASLPCNTDQQPGVENVSAVSGAASPAALDEKAYNSLLPKLLELSEKIDDMSDDQYGDWINSLPKEEFFEFIGVSHDMESFRAAVAVAKQQVAKSRSVGGAASSGNDPCLS
jgi:hypothetical protein